ncbi:ATP-dependent RNA helicase DBP7 [[Candida] zeylanoides]
MSNMDDELLLNFAVPDGCGAAGRRAAKVTGGKWKDRRKQQLSLQGRGRDHKAGKTAASGVNDTTVAKRKAAPDAGDHKRRATAGPSSRAVRFSETNGEFGGKNNSYVSSLFTSNEESTLAAEAAKAAREAAGALAEAAGDAPEGAAAPTASNAPLDTNSFDGLGLNQRLATHLAETLRFKHPTRVQQHVVPRLVAHHQRDLFVKAQTGSGKTLSFLLPVFNALMVAGQAQKITRESGLFGIILVPTRELATQIYGVMETLARCCHHLVPGIVIGGEKKKSEKARLRKGVNVLVATPGRLADHMENTKTFDVSQLRWLILDEGDKLVELGFEETISKITTKIDSDSALDTARWPSLPHHRVNVLCSATMQSSVTKLGSVVLRNAEMINIERDGPVGTTEFNTQHDAPLRDAEGNEVDASKMQAPDQLVQRILVVPPKLRLVTLAALLKRISREVERDAGDVVDRRTIVFFSCADSVDFHFDAFTRYGRQFVKARDDSGKMEVEMVPYDRDHEDDTETGSTSAPSVLTAPHLGSNNVVVHKLHGSLSQQVRTATLQSFVRGKFPNGRRHLGEDEPLVGKHSILFCTDVASRGLDLPSVSHVVEFDPPFTIEDHLHRIGRTARVGREGDATLFLLPGNEEAYVEGKLKVVHPRANNLRVVAYEQVLKDGFSDATTTNKDPKRKEGKWDVHATTWHLEVERWLLEDKSAHDLAVQAFTSHVRAYATHLSTEKQFFNVKLLHLGHLAKSFGLRETPKKLGKSVGTNSAIQEGTLASKRKAEDPRKKMLRMAKMAVKSVSDEFNY